MGNHNFQVAVTPVFPARQHKRRLAEEEEKEEGGGKKVKKEENENAYRIHDKNLRKAGEEQGEMESMVVEGSKLDEKEKLGKGVEIRKELVTIVGEERASPPLMSSQRSPKLLNGSFGSTHCTSPTQPSPSTGKMIPNTAFKQVCTHYNWVSLDKSESLRRKEKVWRARR